MAGMIGSSDSPVLRILHVSHYPDHWGVYLIPPDTAFTREIRGMKQLFGGKVLSEVPDKAGRSVVLDFVSPPT